MQNYFYKCNVNNIKFLIYIRICCRRARERDCVCVCLCDAKPCNLNYIKLLTYMRICCGKSSRESDHDVNSMRPLRHTSILVWGLQTGTLNKKKKAQVRLGTCSKGSKYFLMKIKEIELLSSCEPDTALWTSRRPGRLEGSDEETHSFMFFCWEHKECSDMTPVQ